MIDVETLGKIKESCEIYTPLGLADGIDFVQETSDDKK